MTAAQIQARVDAWLAARSEWIATGPVRLPMLAAQWHAVSLAFGADSSAALGVLLGLVREAWGEPCASSLGLGDDLWVARGRVRVGRRLLDITATTEHEALLAALEAAP